MGSSHQPNKWGYGLTWAVAIGLTGMIAYGATLLTGNAKHGAHELKVDRVKSEEAGKKEIEAKNLKISEQEKKEAEEREKAIAAALTTGPAGDAEKGKVLYNTCLACHGANGAGMPALKSPAIAGQHSWYLEASLNKFLKGIRGADMAKDPQAGQMAMMVKAVLKTDEDVKNVVAYIGTLKPEAPQHSLKGDATMGQALYGTCAACHGVKGEGNPMVKSPALNNLADWYIVEQVKKFKSGVRGTHPDDAEGKIMAPMSQILATDEMITNVAEYIKTLAK